MKEKAWKVGELSRLTGLTIRTLHHYDDIGLLCPAFHTDSGHRLYVESDIVKLQQIMSLKEIGCSLDEIRMFFEAPDYNPKEVIELQLERLNSEIKLKEELKSQLQELREAFDAWRKPTTEQFFKAIELIRNQSRYFTQEQRIQMKRHYTKLSINEADEFSHHWSQLISLFQYEMSNGTPSNDPRVKKLAEKWQEGINLLTGGDKEIVKSAERYYADHPQSAKSSGMSGELYKYIKEAVANIEKS